MENSYRFLMMAAGVLLGIMLFSVFVYLFRIGARANQTIEEKQIEQQLIAENAKFEIYNKADNTISDMISLINLVYDYNEERDWAADDCINLTIYLKKESTAGSPLKINSDTYDLQRNQVKYGSKSISVYQLVSDDIGTILGSDTDYPKTDKFSMTKYFNNQTIYKYLFYQNEFEYDLNTGRIKKMTFILKVNEDWS